MTNPEQPQGGETNQPQPEQEDDQERAPRGRCQIYVASLSDYNAGILHGDWIDAHQSAEDLHADTARILEASQQADAEEWAIHDHEGFGPIHISEYETFDTIAALAEGISQHGDAYAHWTAHTGLDEANPQDFEDHYLGQWTSLVEYAGHILDDIAGLDAITNQAPEHLRPYLKIDVEGFARDLQLSGDVWISEPIDGHIHIYDNHP